MPDPGSDASPASWDERSPSDDAGGHESVPGGLPRRTDRRDEGRSRLARALGRPGRGQVVVAVLLALLGFGGVIQVRANDSDNAYAGLRQQDLIDLLNGLAGTSQRAQDEIQRLQATRDDLLSDTRSRQAALQQARQQSETLAVLDGSVPVRGPGIVITVRDDSGQVPVGAFLNLVESLRTAGAEAMAVDDRVRIVAQTAFAVDDDGLVVGGVSLEAPYTIQAIGDPATLGSALEFPDGPQDELAQDGAELTYDERTSMTIDALGGVTSSQAQQ